jgi:competence protein ComGC
MKIKKQAGFSAIELLMAVVIIILLVVVGWLVYKDHHKTTTTSTNSSSSVIVPKFVFKELGLQMDKPSSSSGLDGLTYTVQNLPNDNGVGTSPTLYLSTPVFSNDVNRCYTQTLSNGESFAAISKISGVYDPTQLGESSLLKQFDGYYIVIGYPNGLTTCTAAGVDRNLVLNEAKQLQTNFVDAFKTATVIQ